MATEVIIQEMSEEYARDLTARIGRALESLPLLIAEAHDDGAWRVMGYATWGAYVAGEFKFSRRESERLVTQGGLMRLLSEEAGRPVNISIRQAEVLRDPSNTTRVSHLIRSGTEPETAVREVMALAMPAKPATLTQPMARRGPPSLGAWWRQMREYQERIDAAFESAGDDALAYLTPEDRREFERTVSSLSAWCERWGNLLSGPVEMRDIEATG